MYGRDEPVIREWVESSKTAEGAKAYLDKYVYGVANHKEYMKMIGDERLSQLVDEREKRV
jgi:hypothetical protein